MQNGLGWWTDGAGELTGGGGGCLLLAGRAPHLKEAVLFLVGAAEVLGHGLSVHSHPYLVFALWQRPAHTHTHTP